MAGNKIKSPQFIDPNPIEAIRDFGQGARDTGKELLNEFSDAGKDSIETMWEQILGIGNYSSSEKTGPQAGELAEGQEIVFSAPKQEEEQQQHQNQEQRPYVPEILPAIDYRREILRGSEQRETARTQEIEVKIQEIIIELKELIAASTVLQAEFNDVVAPQPVVKPGKYHMAFFDWVISTVRSARMRVEDAGAWLGALKSKKAGMSYKEMAKKHGTSFSLSGERTPATQSG